MFLDFIFRYRNDEKKNESLDVFFFFHVPSFVKSIQISFTLSVRTFFVRCVDATTTTTVCDFHRLYQFLFLFFHFLSISKYYFFETPFFFSLRPNRHTVLEIARSVFIPFSFFFSFACSSCASFRSLCHAAFQIVIVIKSNLHTERDREKYFWCGAKVSEQTNEGTGARTYFSCHLSWQQRQQQMNIENE